MPLAPTALQDDILRKIMPDPDGRAALRRQFSGQDHKRFDAQLEELVRADFVTLLPIEGVTGVALTEKGRNYITVKDGENPEMQRPDMSSC